MHEIRLAVCHPDEASRTGIAARLRGAAVEPCADLAQLRDTFEGCHAVVLAGLREWSAIGPILAAGAHVLLVAEPCPPADVIEALSATAAGARLAIVNPDRYLPSRQLIRRQLDGPLGQAGLIRLHRWNPATDHPSGLPEPLLRDLDIALWLADRRPDRVYAAEQRSDESGRYVQIHLGFPGGGMALLDFDGRLPPGDGYQSLSVVAATGAAHADDHQNVQLLYRGGRPQALRIEEHAGQLAAITQEFVDTLRTGHPLPPTAAWRHVFTAANAVCRSLATGQAVTPEGR